MNKAYSNKALPAGTILREWRLEEVLGVGGFGIVYRGRGIYFDELVAIKEYFPSSISERDAEDTVVPIDSDAEEVHALGLKKFVEEAKLLWNLSTPTRHPNIVSVRSLFEIHGTAYMVMDFEDGTSLSKALKEGRRFNERSLWDLIRPIAEGLERAHRVGVLHRDIKPPNILINPDGKPVLIDFGSARFEAAEATSTKVTFHTPPYAAIEQYVKTYPQGPWTDIYALGVVLYECVTGEKPPEVLERMHGGLGSPLAEGKWPGYSRQFLAAIDAAMTIRPTERPQSITEWLSMFEESGSQDVAATADEDDEATRFFAHEVTAEEIVPIAAPKPGFAQDKVVDTKVPKDPGAVEFKRAGEDTAASKQKEKEAAAVAAPKAQEGAVAEKKVATGGPGTRKPAAGSASRAEGTTPANDELPRRLKPLVAAGGALVVVAGALGGWAFLGGDEAPITETAAATGAPAAGVTTAAMLTALQSVGPSTKALADEAREAGAPAEAADRLSAAGDDLVGRYQALQALAAEPSDARLAAGAAQEMNRVAAAAHAQFATALLQDAEARSRRLAAEHPWADPERENAARAESAERKTAAANLRQALSRLRTTVQSFTKTTDSARSLEAARQAFDQSQSYALASSALLAVPKESARLAAAQPEERTSQPSDRRDARAPARTAVATAAPAQAARDTRVSSAKLGQLNSIIDDARGTARQVIRMGNRRSGSRQQQEVRRANAQLARNYDQNLKTLKDSVRGVSTEREADRLIAQANQTRSYVQFLLKQSSGN